MTAENEPRVLNELVDVARLDSGRRDEEAITDGTVRLSWGEYADRVARLAGALADLGVRPGDRVGVHLPKSVDAFVAVHAVLRAGAVMVPLDALAPVAHTAGVLADAGAEVMVTGARAAALAELGEATSLRGIVTRGDDTEVPEGVAHRDSSAVAATPPLDRVPVAPDDPAYVMYTSGSTGRPKGIVHTHRSGLAYARLAADCYGLGPTDRMANLAPLHFDQSTFELYAAPLAGAAVVVVPDGVLRFPASLSSLVEAEAVTVWYSVPYLVEQLVTRGAVDERDLSNLRWVLFGGESFPPTGLARAMAALPGCRFSNVYGPAEVNQCMFFHLDGPPPADEPVPIGRAWAGAELLVLDADDAEVGAGEVGELLVKTDTMMDRYWERPDLTDAALAIRSGPEGDERWYRTGDLVSARPDGNLVFLGRADNQVKVRGHRVELEAVEAVLGDQPAVDACAVVVMRPGDGDDHLVGLVAPVEAAAGDEGAKLMAAMRERLPRYAVPSRVVGVDALPRTPTGKVDRNAAAARLA